MSTLTIDAPVRPAADARAGRAAVSQPDRVAPTRPGQRRKVARTAPVARPLRRLPAPTLRQASSVGPRSCSPEVATPVRAAAAPTRYRLTERGIAVILVAGAMIAVAALAVVGLTALRVTSPSYQVTLQSQASQL
ncbi:MAG: hypothetical protein JWP61_1000 [Friedmanniella sp.]|nr:hypothetical protein [Friedmanniella sp.]